MQLKYVTFLDYACRLIRNLPYSTFRASDPDLTLA